MKRDLTGEANLYGPTISRVIAQCPVCLSYTGCDAGEYRITCKFCFSLFQPRSLSCTQWNAWKDSYANKMTEADKILAEIHS